MIELRRNTQCRSVDLAERYAHHRVVSARIGVALGTRRGAGPELSTGLAARASSAVHSGRKLLFYA